MYLQTKSNVIRKTSTIAAKVSAFVTDWTPFLLVVSYLVFSTCLYMFCTPKLLEIFWFIYLLTNFYIAGATVLESISSIVPSREARRALKRVEDGDWVFPTPDNQLPIMDIVIVAYLPNEKDIIIDRIHFALQSIIYPADRIRVKVLYNTPIPMVALETELHELENKYPRLKVIKVLGSTSKADNLNFFLGFDTGADIIAIFDCDHYAHPYGPRWAAERFRQDSTVDIVQGRCVIFNSRASFLAGLISVEFDKIYASSHPGRAAIWDFGLFAGSNGYWRASLLRDIKMDGSMLTEDIDSALRALEKGAKAVHDLNVLSYELAPTTFPAFWKQRLRWGQGWTQVSWRHFALAWKRASNGGRSVTARFGLLSLLGIRELSYYLVSQYTCLLLSYIILDFPQSPSELARLVFFEFPVSEWLFITGAICLVGTLITTYLALSEFSTLWMMVKFTLIFLPYLILQSVMGVYGHARQVIGYSAWNATTRT